MQNQLKVSPERRGCAVRPLLSILSVGRPPRSWCSHCGSRVASLRGLKYWRQIQACRNCCVAVPCLVRVHCDCQKYGPNIPLLYTIIAPKRLPPLNDSRHESPRVIQDGTSALQLHQKICHAQNEGPLQYGLIATFHDKGYPS